jgi:hypothetical protein
MQSVISVLSCVIQLQRTSLRQLERHGLLVLSAYGAYLILGVPSVACRVLQSCSLFREHTILTYRTPAKYSRPLSFQYMNRFHVTPDNYIE